jgi:hypothetical protein
MLASSHKIENHYKHVTETDVPFPKKLSGKISVSASCADCDELRLKNERYFLMYEPSQPKQVCYGCYLKRKKLF